MYRSGLYACSIMVLVPHWLNHRLVVSTLQGVEQILPTIVLDIEGKIPTTLKLSRRDSGLDFTVPYIRVPAKTFLKRYM